MRVYIAGPYTQGDPVINVRNAMDAADKLLVHGIIPFCPHLTMFWHLVHPHCWETWLNYDESWLSLCDAVLRLPGSSIGADREVAYALCHGIQVYDDIESVIQDSLRETK